MKIIVYLMVFCMLLFLLVLSFEDRRYDMPRSEWDDVGAALEAQMHDSWVVPIQNAMEMRQNNQIVTAQEEGTTALDILVLSIHQALDECCSAITKLTDYVVRHTKETAYQFANDMAELLYPKHSSSSKKVVSQKEKSLPAINAVSSDSSPAAIPMQKLSPDPSIPIPPTMAGKEP